MWAFCGLRLKTNNGNGVVMDGNSSTNDNSNRNSSSSLQYHVVALTRTFVGIHLKTSRNELGRPLHRSVRLSAASKPSSQPRSMGLSVRSEGV